MSTQVQITMELLEKLAGIQRKRSPRQQQQQQQQQRKFQGRLPFAGGGLPPELTLPGMRGAGFGGAQHAAAPGTGGGGGGFGDDEASLQRSIAASQRVGELLLKAGDEELAAVRQQADSLLSKFRAELRPPPCGPEQEAVLQCYKNHNQDVLACAELVDAYVGCAQHAAGQTFS